MATTKFFNNTNGNTLFQKFQGIAQGMTNFDRFLAVAGYFRSSGYFKLRRELEDVKEIKILVGINVDEIFNRHNRALLLLTDEKEAKGVYEKDFIEDVKEAGYTKEIEDGILQMLHDLKDKRLEMRIHPTKNLHAKFYLCLPQNHSQFTDGWVIMGSSNISDSGLGTNAQANRYELNVAMKDYEDVSYCHEEFKTLWNEGVPLTFADFEKYKEKTYLGYQPTPYEIYIKVLIEMFGGQVEDDFSLQLPEGVMELKYQTDAVIQGYQMLLRHNGLFLADVVGLGKTMIATMIAKRFVEANGRHTNILVVFPPALEDNWRQTFELFGIRKRAQFVSNGSLSKILNGEDQYKDKEEFDLVIVDEAHGFRSDTSGKFNELQKICKAPCANPGMLDSQRKKVMLLSATPLNNRPEDLLNQLLLFQDSARCTIDGVPNLKSFFSPYNAVYKKLMSERESRDITKDVDKMYEAIREKVIDKVTIRRTRYNILNDEEYRADVKAQGIVFPNIMPPKKIEYQMTATTSNLFKYTLALLSDEEFPGHLHYARYRAIEFLKPEWRQKYTNAEHMAQTLAGIYRVHMVKRLESSFHAFKISQKTLLQITNDMIKMFSEDKVIIAPELKVKELQSKGMEIDQIIEYAMEKGYSKEEIVYPSECFNPKFLEMLKEDKATLEALNKEWEQENSDPKFEQFKNHLSTVFLSKDKNPTGKLVVFSESVDTLEYLQDRLTNELGRTDVLLVSAKNRTRVKKDIKENFDANSNVKKDTFNVIFTSDVLAEGVNLHRSNVIVNYDSPWNATRLMQRIGRVNRIGSVAENILNYMFYPSDEGNKEIKLKENALVKLQGFHSAFGEDAQIYSTEEIVKQFEMYDKNVKDMVDKKIELLRELRDLYKTDRELYDKIKRLPLKSRVMRQTGKHPGKTVTFISSNVKTEFYLADDKQVVPIDFLEAVKYLKAKPCEEPAPFTGEERHYSHVNRAIQKFEIEHIQASDTSVVQRKNMDKPSLEAKKFLRDFSQVMQLEEIATKCSKLDQYIDLGRYSQLTTQLRKLSRSYKGDREKLRNDARIIEDRIDNLLQEYHSEKKQEETTSQNITPTIVISETFL